VDYGWWRPWNSSELRLVSIFGHKNSPWWHQIRVGAVVVLTGVSYGWCGGGGRPAAVNKNGGNFLSQTSGLEHRKAKRMR
jgi:hypothetical protein